MTYFRLAGSRIIKTGISIFITAWICVLLDWPPVFAVITALVTIEPTVSDSIRKGLVRFPASAIGSAYAVIFITLFSDSPLTYALAAVFTIATCYKLKLYDGLLIATLTSIAMIEVIHTSVLMSFFIRLGTTTTGLVVSTAVNMFVLPPDYTQKIAKRLESISFRTGIAVEKVVQNLLDEDHDVVVIEEELADQLDNMIHKTEQLIRFQSEESKYHSLERHEWKHFQQERKQLGRLKLIHYHLGNLIYSTFNTPSWPDHEQTAIKSAVTDVAQSLKHPETYERGKHREQFKRLTDIFWDDNRAIAENSVKQPANLPPELTILYELLSIYSLVEKYYENPQ